MIIENSNEYFIKTNLESQNNFNINSNSIDIIINDLDIETKNIGLNKQILENIALNYGGNYYDLEKLSDYLKSVKKF